MCNNQPALSYSFSSAKFRILVFSLIIFSSFTIFYHLGSNSIHNGDEALYTIISREMLITGDWLTPQVQGEPCFNKPPLKFWLTALCFRFFGTSEWVIRLLCFFLLKTNYTGIYYRFIQPLPSWQASFLLMPSLRPGLTGKTRHPAYFCFVDFSSLFQTTIIISSPSEQ